MVTTYSQFLIVDRTITGSLANIYEQILGSSDSVNEHEAATNALIEYALCQGYTTILFADTHLMPFCTSPTDATFRTAGRDKLRDVISRIRSTSILGAGLVVDGSNLNQYKRIADYNSTASASQKISSVYISSEWWDLSGSSATYTTLRDHLLNAIDDGVGASQVNWGGAANRIQMIVDVGDARTIGDVFTTGGAIAYDQLCNLSESLKTEYEALGLTPVLGSTLDPTFDYQPLVFSFRCFQSLPNYANIRTRAWKLLSDNGLWVRFYDPDPIAMSQSESLYMSASPETPQENGTGAYSATRYYSGYFFEGRSRPASAPLTEPAITFYKKDALAAFEYVVWDVSTAIATDTALTIIFGLNITPVGLGQSWQMRHYGDIREAVNSRIYNSGQPANFNSLSPYENLQDTSPSIYAYEQDTSSTFRPDFSAISGVHPFTNLYNPVDNMSFSGIVITTQYFMRNLDSLPHAPLILDTPDYTAAVPPTYTDKYHQPCFYFSSAVNAAPFAVPVVVYDAINQVYEPINTDSFGTYFKIIHDDLPKTGITPNRIYWLEASTGLDYANVNSPNPIVDPTSHVPVSNVPARFSIIRSGRTNTYYEAHNAAIQAADTGSLQAFWVQVQAVPLSVSIVLVEPIECSGGTDSKISATAVGGTAPYTYQWYLGDPDFGGTLLVGETDVLLENVAAGNYWMRVTDNVAATAKAGFFLTEPGPIIINLLNFGNRCSGVNNGFIVVDVFGGTPGYEFMWVASGGGSIPAGQATNQNLTDLTAGTYTLTVTDQNACTKVFAQAIISITPPSATITSSGTLTTCPGSTMSLNVAPAQVAPYDTWTWSTGDVDTYSTIVDAPGTYYLIGYIGGCPAVSNSIVVTAAALALDEIEVINVQCGTTDLGQILITVVGGCPPYTFLWTYPDLSTQTTQNIANLQPGNYTILVTDAALDTVTDVVTVGTDTFTADVDTTDAGCAGSLTGQIDVDPIAGTPPYTFQFYLNSVLVATNTTGLLAAAQSGDYEVVITDANGCVANIDVTLGGYSAVTGIGVVQDESIIGAEDGAINFTPSGGTGPYTYLWSNGATTQDIGSLAAGDYTVTITDANTCTGQVFFTVGVGGVVGIIDGIDCQVASATEKFFNLIDKGLDGDFWMKRALYLRLAKAALLRYKTQLEEGTTPCADYEAIVQRVEECGC